jgi:hypothetical protein
VDPNINFIEFLKACITPVALISGVGLLLLSITNRLGRTIDRTRILVAELDKETVQRRDNKINEVKILHRRSEYLRMSIGAITVSVITSSLIIPLLFFMILFGLDLKVYGYILFILSILSILISAIYFFLDVVLSLNAIYLEANQYLGEKK